MFHLVAFFPHLVMFHLGEIRPSLPWWVNPSYFWRIARALCSHHTVPYQSLSCVSLPLGTWPLFSFPPWWVEWGSSWHLLRASHSWHVPPSRSVLVFSCFVFIVLPLKAQWQFSSSSWWIGRSSHRVLQQRLILITFHSLLICPMLICLSKPSGSSSASWATQCLGRCMSIFLSSYCIFCYLKHSVALAYVLLP